MISELPIIRRAGAPGQREEFRETIQQIAMGGHAAVSTWADEMSDIPSLSIKGLDVP